MSRGRRRGGQSRSPQHPAPAGAPKGPRRSGKKPPSGPRKPSPAEFWGGTPADVNVDGDGETPAPVERIRPTPDPGALPRSLGDPPLGTNPVIAQHQLAAVYEEAVRAATALAAANGLLDTDEI